MQVNDLPVCVQAYAGGASASAGQKYPAGGHFPPPLQRVVRGDGHCNYQPLHQLQPFSPLQRVVRGDGHCNLVLRRIPAARVVVTVRAA